MTPNVEESMNCGRFFEIFRTLGILMPTTSTIKFSVDWFRTSNTLPNKMLMDKSSLCMLPNMSVNNGNKIFLPPHGNFEILAIWCPNYQECFQFWFDACSSSNCSPLGHSCRNKSGVMGNLKLNIVVNKYWKHVLFYSDCEQFNTRTLLTKA